MSAGACPSCGSPTEVDPEVTYCTNSVCGWDSAFAGVMQRLAEPVPSRTPLVAWFDQLHDLTPQQRDAAFVKLTGDLIVDGMTSDRHESMHWFVQRAIEAGKQAAA